MFFPVLIHALDLVVSSVAVMLTKPRRLGLGRSLPTTDDVVDAEKGQGAAADLSEKCSGVAHRLKPTLAQPVGRVSSGIGSACQ